MRFERCVETVANRLSRTSPYLRSTEEDMTRPGNMALGIALGVGLGSALGAAVLDDIAIGVAIGIAVGAAVGAVLPSRS